MKFLMCYPQSYEWEETGRFIHEALEKQGQEVRIFDDMRMYQDFGIHLSNVKLLEKISREKPDVLFMLKSETIMPDTLDKIKCKKILWHPDVRYNVQDWVVEKARKCDIFYTMSKGSIKQYKEKGIKAKYLPEACAPKYHFYTDNVSHYFKSDVNFIGTVRQDRIDMCRRVANYWKNEFSGFRFKIWGSLEKEDAVLERHFMNRCVWREYHSYAASGSISITWDWCPPVELSYSARIYRVMASRGLYLCKYVNGMENVFKQGVHCDWYETLDEMIDKISYYLENPDLIKKIGKNAQKEVYKKHTFDHRIKKILEDLK
ncbi:MAG: hypothetical protein DRO11_05880 [Methanobacteriota archaeon]|nr:MAG: hypothetical protein DRO11_05880 [Euryarchaeota archaeon]